MIDDLITAQLPADAKPRFRIFFNYDDTIYCARIYAPLQTVWFDSLLQGLYGIKSNGQKI